MREGKTTIQIKKRDLKLLRELCEKEHEPLHVIISRLIDRFASEVLTNMGYDEVRIWLLDHGFRQVGEIS